MSSPFGIGGDSKATQNITAASDNASALHGNRGIIARDGSLVLAENSKYVSPFGNFLDRIKLGENASLTINQTAVPPEIWQALKAQSDAAGAAIHDAVAELGKQNQAGLSQISDLATSVQTGGVSSLLKGLLAIVLGIGALWATVKLGGFYFQGKNHG